MLQKVPNQTAYWLDYMGGGGGEGVLYNFLKYLNVRLLSTDYKFVPAGYSGPV